MRRAALALLLLAGFLLLRPGGLAGDGTPANDLPAPAERGTAEASPGAASPAEPEPAAISETQGGHLSPVTPVLLALVLILGIAKVGGEVAERLHQPAVLGELVAGVIVGNLTLLGIHELAFIGHSEPVAILAELGVILLLFEVGLESNVHEMMSVGTSSLLVAVLGVIAPFFIGWGIAAWMVPEQETLVHVFIGATLCATSVGITARVLTDLGKVSTREAKIILGAAVIDDVLGLVILAVVSGVISAAAGGGSLEAFDVFLIVLKATAFLFGALVLGTWISPRLFRLASRLHIQGMLLTVSLSFCFLLAYLASVIELAPIVGAFAAGLILEDLHYREFLERGEHALEELIHPIAVFLVPVFFVLMGIRVELSTFGNVAVLGFAGLLTAGAILGKMICALGVVERGLDRISVAVGMVPRGEVGLIFAGIGASLKLHGHPVISPAIYSAVVIMVILTTLVTPPVLKISLARGERRLEAGRRQH